MSFDLAEFPLLPTAHSIPLPFTGFFFLAHSLHEMILRMPALVLIFWLHIFFCNELDLSDNFNYLHQSICLVCISSQKYRPVYPTGQLDLSTWMNFPKELQTQQYLLSTASSFPILPLSRDPLFSCWQYHLIAIIM